MIMNNKKSLTNSVVLALSFGIIATMLIFIALFTNNLMNYTVTEVSTELSNFTVDQGYNIATTNAINNLGSSYGSIDFRVDTIFMISWGLLILVSLLSAWLAPPLPSFNFFTYLIFGMMIFLFVANFLNQIMIYLQTELLTSVFTASELYLPVYNFYTANYYEIFIIWFVVILIVNQISFNKSTFRQQLQEEVIE